MAIEIPHYSEMDWWYFFVVLKCFSWNEKMEMFQNIIFMCILSPKIPVVTESLQGICKFVNIIIKIKGGYIMSKEDLLIVYIILKFCYN